jgi:HPt (histidine-containing phosphotransfer) domain-containing protein
MSDPRLIWSRLEQSMGSSSARMVLDLFVDEAHARLASMRARLAAADDRGLALEAHALKGAAGFLGFGAVVERCTRLEDRCQEPSSGSQKVELARVDRAVAEALRQIRDLRHPARPLGALMVAGEARP